MRAALLRGLSKRPAWRPVDADLLHLFRSWFNRGFLRVERIDWRTPAIVLEKIIAYEAVHAIQGWRDLRRRLESDRRCYGFFHPQLPHEPLIFIEVALTQGMSAQVQPLLEVQSTVADPAQADCAIFYSITNCQEGLRGTSFGMFNFTSGIATFAAGTLAGALWQWHGPKATFLTAAAFSLASLIGILWWHVRAKPGMPSNE